MDVVWYTLDPPRMTTRWYVERFAAYLMAMQNPRNPPHDAVRDKQTNKQTKKQTNRQTGKQTNKQTNNNKTTINSC